MQPSSNLLHSSPTTRQLGEVGRTGRGHIGLIVASSIALGLALGLVLDLVVLAGSEETVITGTALLSFAFGCATLSFLSAWCTDEPQGWARVRSPSWRGLWRESITLGSRSLALA